MLPALEVVGGAVTVNATGVEVVEQLKVLLTVTV